MRLTKWDESWRVGLLFDGLEVTNDVPSTLKRGQKFAKVISMGSTARHAAPSSFGADEDGAGGSFEEDMGQGACVARLILFHDGRVAMAQSALVSSSTATAAPRQSPLRVTFSASSLNIVLDRTFILRMVAFFQVQGSEEMRAVALGQLYQWKEQKSVQMRQVVATHLTPQLSIDMQAPKFILPEARDVVDPAVVVLDLGRLRFANSGSGGGNSGGSESKRQDEMRSVGSIGSRSSGSGGSIGEDAEFYDNWDLTLTSSQALLLTDPGSSELWRDLSDGVGEDQHLVEPFDINLSLATCVLPSHLQHHVESKVRVHGQLPRLSCHIDSDQVSYLRSFQMALLPRTPARGQEPNNSGTPSAERGDESKRDSLMPVAESVLNDWNSGQRQPSASLANMLFDFSVLEVAVALRECRHRTGPGGVVETTRRDVVQMRITDLGGSLKEHSTHNEVRGHMRSLHIEDCIQRRPLVQTTHTEEDASLELIRIDAVFLHPTHAGEVASIGGGKSDGNKDSDDREPDQINLAFSELQLEWDPETVARAMAVLHQRSTADESETTHDLSSNVPVVTLAAGGPDIVDPFEKTSKVVDKSSYARRTQVHCTLKRLGLRLNKPAISRTLLDIRLDDVLVEMQSQGDKTDITGTLRDLSVWDRSYESAAWNGGSQVFGGHVNDVGDGIEGDEGKDAEDNAPGSQLVRFTMNMDNSGAIKQSMLKVEVSRARIVYIQGLCLETVDYLMQGVMGALVRSGVQQLGEAVVQHLEQQTPTSRTLFDVSLVSPSIMVPASASSSAFLHLSSDKIVASNVFENQPASFGRAQYVAGGGAADGDAAAAEKAGDTLLMDHINVKIAALSLCVGDGGADLLVEPVDLALDVWRLADSALRRDPRMVVEGRISDIYLRLAHHDYVQIMDTMDGNINAEPYHGGRTAEEHDGSAMYGVNSVAESSITFGFDANDGPENTVVASFLMASAKLELLEGELGRSLLEAVMNDLRVGVIKYPSSGMQFSMSLSSIAVTDLRDYGVGGGGKGRVQDRFRRLVVPIHDGVTAGGCGGLISQEEFKERFKGDDVDELSGLLASYDTDLDREALFTIIWQRISDGRVLTAARLSHLSLIVLPSTLLALEKFFTKGVARPSPSPAANRRIQKPTTTASTGANRGGRGDAVAAMWLLAAERFATPPYSNGHDKRYEAVKAELRALYGANAINADNKAQLKVLAAAKGVDYGDEMKMAPGTPVLLERASQGISAAEKVLLDQNLTKIVVIVQRVKVVLPSDPSQGSTAASLCVVADFDGAYRGLREQEESNINRNTTVRAREFEAFVLHDVADFLRADNTAPRLRDGGEGKGQDGEAKERKERGEGGGGSNYSNSAPLGDLLDHEILAPVNLEVKYHERFSYYVTRTDRQSGHSLHRESSGGVGASGGERTTQLLLACDPCTSSLSFRDLDMLDKIRHLWTHPVHNPVHAGGADDEGEVCGEEGGEGKGEADGTEDGNGNSGSGASPSVAPSATAEMMLDEIVPLVKSLEISINCGDVSLLVINDRDGRDLPVIDVRLTALSAFLNGSPVKFAAGMFATFAPTVYNVETVQWEPLMEPWPISVLVQRDKAEHVENPALPGGGFVVAPATLDVRLEALTSLQMSVTDVFLRNLLSSVGHLGQGDADETKKATRDDSATVATVAAASRVGAHVRPYTIENALGIDVVFGRVEDDYGAEEGEANQDRLRPGETSSFHFVDQHVRRQSTAVGGGAEERGGGAGDGGRRRLYSPSKMNNQYIWVELQVPADVLGVAGGGETMLQPWKRLRIFCVNRLGVWLVPLETADTMPDGMPGGRRGDLCSRRAVVLDVSVKEGRTVIVLRSCLTIENYSAMDTDVFVDTDASAPSGGLCIGVAKAMGGRVSLPLLMDHLNDIRIRPHTPTTKAADEGSRGYEGKSGGGREGQEDGEGSLRYGWSGPIICDTTFATASQVAECQLKGSPTFHVSVSRSSNRGLTVPLPGGGHREERVMCVAPTATVRNLLPCTVQYAIQTVDRDTGGRRGGGGGQEAMVEVGRGLVRAGQTVSLFGVHPQLKPRLYLHMAGFEWGGGLSLDVPQQTVELRSSGEGREEQARITLLVEVDEVVPGSLQVSLEVRHWLCNRSGLPLGFRAAGKGTPALCGWGPLADHVHETHEGSGAARGAAGPTGNGGGIEWAESSAEDKDDGSADLRIIDIKGVKAGDAAESAPRPLQLRLQTRHTAPPYGWSTDREVDAPSVVEPMVLQGFGEAGRPSVMPIVLTVDTPASVPGLSNTRIVSVVPQFVFQNLCEVPLFVHAAEAGAPKLLLPSVGVRGGQETATLRYYGPDQVVLRLAPDLPMSEPVILSSDTMADAALCVAPGVLALRVQIEATALGNTTLFSVRPVGGAAHFGDEKTQGEGEGERGTKQDRAEEADRLALAAGIRQSLSDSSDNRVDGDGLSAIDGDACVVILQPLDRAGKARGRFKARSWSASTATLLHRYGGGNADSHRLMTPVTAGCWSIDDMVTAEGERPLKWRQHSFAGRIVLPPGIRATLYEGWDSASYPVRTIDGPTGAGGGAGGGAGSAEGEDFWDEHLRVCSFRFEVIPGWRAPVEPDWTLIPGAPGLQIERGGGLLEDAAAAEAAAAITGTGMRGGGNGSSPGGATATEHVTFKAIIDVPEVGVTMMQSPALPGHESKMGGTQPTNFARQLASVAIQSLWVSLSAEVVEEEVQSKDAGQATRGSASSRSSRSLGSPAAPLTRLVSVNLDVGNVFVRDHLPGSPFFDVVTMMPHGHRLGRGSSLSARASLLATSGRRGGESAQGDTGDTPLHVTELSLDVGRLRVNAHEGYIRTLIEVFEDIRTEARGAGSLGSGYHSLDDHEEVEEEMARLISKLTHQSSSIAGGGRRTTARRVHVDRLSVSPVIAVITFLRDQSASENSAEDRRKRLQQRIARRGGGGKKKGGFVQNLIAKAKFRVDNAELVLERTDLSSMRGTVASISATVGEKYARDAKSQVVGLLGNVKLLEWKEISGRSGGGDEYQFGDFARGVVRKIGQKINLIDTASALPFEEEFAAIKREGRELSMREIMTTAKRRIGEATESAAFDLALRRLVFDWVRCQPQSKAVVVAIVNRSSRPIHAHAAHLNAGERWGFLSGSGGHIAEASAAGQAARGGGGTWSAALSMVAFAWGQAPDVFQQGTVDFALDTTAGTVNVLLNKDPSTVPTLVARDGFTLTLVNSDRDLGWGKFLIVVDDQMGGAATGGAPGGRGGGAVAIPRAPRDLATRVQRASRGAIVTIHNGTADCDMSLYLLADPTSGEWASSPPRRIPPGATGEFGCIAQGLLQGAEGRVEYTVTFPSGVYANVAFSMDVPFGGSSSHSFRMGARGQDCGLRVQTRKIRGQHGTQLEFVVTQPQAQVAVGREEKVGGVSAPPPPPKLRVSMSDLEELGTIEVPIVDGPLGLVLVPFKKIPGCVIVKEVEDGQIARGGRVRAGDVLISVCGNNLLPMRGGGRIPDAALPLVFQDVIGLLRSSERPGTLTFFRR